MRPVRRVRRASHEVVEFMGQSVDNFSKIGNNQSSFSSWKKSRVMSNIHICLYMVLNRI